MSVGLQYDRILLCNTSWEILPVLLSVCLSTSILSVTYVSRHWINYCPSRFFFPNFGFQNTTTDLLVINVWFARIYQIKIVPVFHEELRRVSTCEDAPCLCADEFNDCWIGKQQLHYRLTVWDTAHMETRGHHPISGVSHVLQLRRAVTSHMCGTQYVIINNT
jgi:hypothetical protein